EGSPAYSTTTGSCPSPVSASVTAARPPGAEHSSFSCISATASAMTATRWRRAPGLEDEPMARRPGSQHAEDHLLVVDPRHARGLGEAGVHGRIGVDAGQGVDLE